MLLLQFTFRLNRGGKTKEQQQLSAMFTVKYDVYSLNRVSVKVDAPSYINETSIHSCIKKSIETHQSEICNLTEDVNAGIDIHDLTHNLNRIELIFGREN